MLLQSIDNTVSAIDFDFLTFNEIAWIFSEAYPMKIVSQIKLNVRRFQKIPSIEHFRLYFVQVGFFKCHVQLTWLYLQRQLLGALMVDGVWDGVDKG